MNYQDLQAARGILGITERATLKQIKQGHRALVKEHHPDQGAGTDSEKIREINAAYEILRAYCENYRYCFSEEEFLEQVPTERLRRQFSNDPLWEGGGS